MHPLPKDSHIELQEGFTDPFRYRPHPCVQAAAWETIMHIDATPELSSSFAEGKMLGVLIVSDSEGKLGYLRGFSGNTGGRSEIEGFVSPIYDLTSPDGYFKVKEKEISEINERIRQLTESEELSSIRKEIEKARHDMDEALKVQKARMQILKAERDEIRCETQDSSRLAMLIKESQFEKAELKRLKMSWENRISLLNQTLDTLTREISDLKRQRKEMSDALQEWIFRQYVVHNANGERSSIYKIFSQDGLLPPGGTGECAAPKMLEYAYRHDLKPIAMGEFWYGASPESAVRTKGHFYPSCTSKCKPLLSYMLKGIRISTSDSPEECAGYIPEALYIDEDIIVISKRSGVPSVPGMNGILSIQERLEKVYGHIESVHRLDMDTSGVMVFARNPVSAVNLRQQFEEHTIKKTYRARLSHPEEGICLKKGDEGRVIIPLSSDYDERPRQKADDVQGKEAITDFEVEDIRENGQIDIIFRPMTGRTHQLRVHSAHIRGLGHPIVGDLLYGGEKHSRLCLHAAELVIRHPATGESMTFESLSEIYR